MIRAGGSTSVGCGLDYILYRGLTVDGIAIISDGEENQYPLFAERYKAYQTRHGTEPTVYYYKSGKSSNLIYGRGDTLAYSLNSAGIVFTTFELDSTVDYYSIPNLAKTMNTKRYDLNDRIMETPLIRLGDVFDGSVQQKRASHKSKGRLAKA
jgi:hypothetical protein